MQVTLVPDQPILPQLERLPCINDYPELVDRTLRLIHSDFRIHIKNIALQLGYSNRHLRRQFSKLLGIAPKEYQQLYRIIAAAENLQNGNFNNLTQLALDHGFSDQAHFQRVFRQYLRETPRHFLL